MWSRMHTTTVSLNITQDWALHFTFALRPCRRFLPRGTFHDTRAKVFICVHQQQSPHKSAISSTVPPTRTKAQARPIRTLASDIRPNCHSGFFGRASPRPPLLDCYCCRFRPCQNRQPFGQAPELFLPLWLGEILLVCAFSRFRVQRQSKSKIFVLFQMQPFPLRLQTGKSNCLLLEMLLHLPGGLPGGTAI